LGNNRLVLGGKVVPKRCVSDVRYMYGGNIAMDRMLFVTDLDGTLLRSDQTLSDYSAAVLNAAMEEKNCIVSFATARGLISALSVVPQVAWRYPVILYNGALLYDISEDRVIDGCPLDNEIAKEIVAMGYKHGISPYCFLLDADHRERVYHEKLSTFGMAEFRKSRGNDPRFREVGRIECSKDSFVLALTYIYELERLLPFKAEVESAFGAQIHSHLMKDYYIENQYFLEFGHPLASKSQGLKMWAKHMGANAADICVFGDQVNDLGLFEAGGTRVAVANSHEDILRLADVIIEGNNDDGVAKYIEKCMTKNKSKVIG